MTGSQALGLVFGIAIGFGFWLLTDSLRRRARKSFSRPVARIDPRRAPLTLGVAATAAVLTRWPVAAAAAGVLTWYWPRIVGANAGDRQRIARLDGLATWTESLRDSVAGAIGLEQAIPATAATCAPSIRPQALRLAGQLHARVPLTVALRGLADDLGDASADLIVAALVLSSQLRGPGLRDTLTALATSSRAELEMRQRVEAGRKAIRRGASIIAGVTACFAGALVLFNSRYLQPYGSPVGQVVLVIVCVVFGIGFGWLGRLSAPAAQGRIFATADPTR